MKPSMSKSFTEIIKEIWNEKKRYFEDYKRYAEIIKDKAKELLGDAKVIVFGSVVRDDYTPASDIDILIISDNLPDDQEKRAELRTQIKSSVGRPNPFQIHLITPEEFEKTYKSFIKEDFEEI